MRFLEMGRGNCKGFGSQLMRCILSDFNIICDLGYLLLLKYEFLRCNLLLEFHACRCCVLRLNSQVCMHHLGIASPNGRTGVVIN